MNARLGKVPAGVLFFLSLLAFGLAAWAADITVRRWEVVSTLAFSPDGGTLAAGAYDGKAFNRDLKFLIGDVGQTVVLLDADTGATQHVLERTRHRGTWGGGSAGGQFLAFSPDGGTLAIAKWDRTIVLYDPREHRIKDTLQREHPYEVAALAFSKDGRMLAAGCWPLFMLWDTASYGKERTFFTSSYKGAIALSPDSTRIAADSWAEDRVELWDIAQGKPTETIPISYRIYALQFSPDGKSLAIGGEKSATVWNLGQAKKRFEVHSSWTSAVAFTPDGKVLATVGSDGLRLWEVEGGKAIERLKADGRIKSVAFSPDGSLVATGDWSGNVIVWDVASGTKRWGRHVDGPWKFGPLPIGVGTVALVLLALALRASWKNRRRPLGLPRN